ncbi:MAG: hypothetical protein LBK60_03405 [Verrucomicrobiales bacterium]|jgi:hypothetical protein|nr:hypothetical protein [Verrucomicrobiales bacterium]
MNSGKRVFQRGFALPMILIFMAAMIVLIVGLFLAMNHERRAAYRMVENEKAKLVAATAQAHALALLENIPQPIPPSNRDNAAINADHYRRFHRPAINWVTAPGMLTLIQGAGGVRQIPLSSNPTPDYNAQADDFNLNAPLYEKDAAGRHIFPIIGAGSGGTAPEIRVAWVNQLKDPARAAAADNPITARYAFWIDDESTKLNLNVAHGKPNAGVIHLEKPNPLMQRPLNELAYRVLANNATKGDFAIPIKTGAKAGANVETHFPLWHPAAENLEVLTIGSTSIDREALSKALLNYQLGGLSNSANAPTDVYLLRPLQNINGIYPYLVGGDPAEQDLFFQTNKFDLTVSGQSPEFNVFGKSRLYFERFIPPLDPAMYFQQDYDLDGPTYTHAAESAAGVSGNIWYPNASGITDAAGAIAKFLARDDWPGMPARSFVDKWGGGDLGRREVDQVAYNMVIMAAYGAGRQMAGAADTDWPEGENPVSNLLNNATNHAPGGKQVSTNNSIGNNRCFLGSQSGKAILPYYPVPYINKIAVDVHSLEVLDSDSNPCVPRRFVLAFGFRYAVAYGGPDKTATTGQLMPLVAYHPAKVAFNYIPRFHPTHVEYTVTDLATDSILTRQTQYFDNSNNPQSIISPQSRASYYDTVFYADQTSPAIDVKSGDYSNVVQSTYYAYILKTAAAAKTDLAGYASGSPPNIITYDAKNNRVLVDGRIANGVETFTAANSSSGNSIISLNLGIRVCNLMTGDFPFPGKTVWQLIPVWDKSDGPAFHPPDNQDDRVRFTVALNPADVCDDGGATARILELPDPRLGGNSAAWQPADNDALITAPVTMPAVDKSKIAYHSFHAPAYGSIFPRETIGMLSVIPTGMQRNRPFATLKFQPSTNDAELPDWLVLELFAPGLQPFGFMNSAVGKINPNAGFNGLLPAAQRWKPLQALFENTTAPLTAGPRATAPAPLVRNILEHNLSGKGFGAPGVYDYIGKLCEVAGFADSGANDWEREALMRNYANLLTTRSNSFTIWGVAQIVRKSSANRDYGKFEPGDQVVGEKRFRAEVNRAVWPGIDGVPGNGMADDAGQLNKTARPVAALDYLGGRAIGDSPWSGLPFARWATITPPYGNARWPVIDGPDHPTKTPTSVGNIWGTVEEDSSKPDNSLENAANPLRAWLRLNVNSFEYLDQ